jgi:hypothetical protein
MRSRPSRPPSPSPCACAVERDRRTRALDAILGAEGAARLWLTLEQTFGGLVSLGVARETALATVRTVALDSVPPQRLAAYRYVQKYSGQDVDTSDVATELGLPTTSARRVLEDLAAYRLINRMKQGEGKADLWVKTTWEQDERKQAREERARLAL